MSTSERCSPAGKTDPRQTDSFCIRHQRGHGYRNLKKRGPYIDGPLFSALPSINPSAATTTARPGPGPRGQPHPVELKVWQKRGPVRALCQILVMEPQGKCGHGMSGHKRARGGLRLPGGDESWVQLCPEPQMHEARVGNTLPPAAAHLSLTNHCRTEPKHSHLWSTFCIPGPSVSLFRPRWAHLESLG